MKFIRKVHCTISCMLDKAHYIRNIFDSLPRFCLIKKKVDKSLVETCQLILCLCNTLDALFPGCSKLRIERNPKKSFASFDMSLACLSQCLYFTLWNLFVSIYVCLVRNYLFLWNRIYVFFHEFSICVHSSLCSVPRLIIFAKRYYTFSKHPNRGGPFGCFVWKVALSWFLCCILWNIYLTLRESV